MNNYIIANRTDVGRERQVNEDNMTTFDSPNGRVIAVCDGMGGQAAGDVASKLACDIIRDILENNTFPDPNEAITRAIMAANQAILHRADQNPELEGMGATCVMLIIRNGKVYYGWVGDSRIYQFYDHKLSQVSKDQSYVQMLVDQGEITAEEAENHPQKNEITNALGLRGMTPPLLAGDPVEAKPGMIFMLCSDGLTNMVGVQQIERELNKTDLSLQEKADKLVFLANQYGGTDNITVQLVEFTDRKAAPAPAPEAIAEAKNPAVKPQSAAPRMSAPPAKKKSNKSQIIAIIACLIVILVAICAYFFVAGNDSATEIENTSTIENKATKPKTETVKHKVVSDGPATTAPAEENVEKPAQPEKARPEPQKTISPAEAIKNKDKSGANTDDKAESTTSAEEPF